MLEPDYGGYQWCAATARKTGKPCRQKGWIANIDQPYYCPGHQPAD